MTPETKLSKLCAYDKNGLPIMVGDVLKIFHFTGRRRKRHYMYKQVVEVRHLNPTPSAAYLCVSHLNLKPFGQPDSGYHLLQDGRVHTDIEIVQGVDPYWDERPRRDVSKARKNEDDA